MTQNPAGSKERNYRRDALRYCPLLRSLPDVDNIVGDNAEPNPVFHSDEASRSRRRFTTLMRTHCRCAILAVLEPALAISESQADGFGGQMLASLPLTTENRHGLKAASYDRGWGVLSTSIATTYHCRIR